MTSSTSSVSSENQDLNVSLYSTTLKLELTGRKRDMIHFIHYFENVGSIELDDQELKIYNDNFITRL